MASVSLEDHPLQLPYIPVPGKPEDDFASNVKLDFSVRLGASLARENHAETRMVRNELNLGLHTRQNSNQSVSITPRSGPSPRVKAATPRKKVTPSSGSNNNRVKKDSTTIDLKSPNGVKDLPTILCIENLYQSVLPECPAGSRKMTHNNVTSCYTFHLTPLSWYDAVKECKKESPKGHLVSVNTKYEHEYLVGAIENDAGFTSVGPNGWYTSGNDEHYENHFVWTNTGYPEALNFTNWKPGQPNNVGDSQNCLLLQYADSRYEWGDVNCADKHPFICEIPL